MKELFDTIVAPATSITKQAISVIRISGEDSFKIINKLLHKKVPIQKGTFLRNLYDHNELLIDQVLIHIFIGKNSFTGENSIEINCHGGVMVTQKIISEIIFNGARLAERGEFSKRAFLNEKISLIQAQGINDLIESKNNLNYRVSVENMSSKTSATIIEIKNKLIDIISEIQTAIDYPEYEETENTTSNSIKDNISNLWNKIEKSINISKRISNFKNGIRTAIIGKPNTGKSSLLNSILNEDKAIVSDVLGTTRDIVEGEINLTNFSLNLLDTAGIRNTESEIEKIGINKSINAAKNADLILYLIDIEEEDLKLIDIDFNKTIFIVNKKDLLTKNQIEEIKHKFKNNSLIFISALNNDIENLIQAIEQKYNMEDIFENDNFILSNSNEIALLKKTNSKIKKAIDSIEMNYTIDLINIDLREAIEHLNELLGVEDIQDAIIDNIFKKYCLGK